MSSKNLFAALITGIVFGMLAVLITWLGGGATSPFREYFQRNVELSNLWGMLNFPAYMGLMITGARSFAAGFLFIFLQWSVIGSAGTLVLRWIGEPSENVNREGDEIIPPSQRLR
jgi:hypothetical protein